MDQVQKHKNTWLDPSKLKNRASKILNIQRTNDTIALILEGKENEEIKDYLIKKYGLSESGCYITITRARKVIQKRKLYEASSLIEQHLERYELIYAMANKYGIDSVALPALKSKEKLLGFHKNNTHMKVNNEQITTITVGGELAYDPDRLTPQQLNRLQELMQKAKSNRALELEGGK